MTVLPLSPSLCFSRSRQFLHSLSVSTDVRVGARRRPPSTGRAYTHALAHCSSVYFTCRTVPYPTDRLGSYYETSHTERVAHLQPPRPLESPRIPSLARGPVCRRRWSPRARSRSRCAGCWPLIYSADRLAPHGEMAPKPPSASSASADGPTAARAPATGRQRTKRTRSGRGGGHRRTGEARVVVVGIRR